MNDETTQRYAPLMGDLLKAFDITLSLRLEVREINESNVPRRGIGGRNAEQVAAWIAKETEATRALLHVTLARPQYQDVVVPALLTGLTEPSLQQLVQAYFGIDESALFDIYEQDTETLNEEHRAYFKEAIDAGLLPENVVPYLNASKITLAAVQIMEKPV